MLSACVCVQGIKKAKEPTKATTEELDEGDDVVIQFAAPAGADAPAAAAAAAAAAPTHAPTNASTANGSSAAAEAPIQITAEDLEEYLGREDEDERAAREQAALKYLSKPTYNKLMR